MDKLEKGWNDLNCSNQDNLKIVFSAYRHLYICLRLLRMVGKPYREGMELGEGVLVVLLMGVAFTSLQNMKKNRCFLIEL